MQLGAIFDWDGVVIDSALHHEKSWDALAKEEGKTLPSDHFSKGFGRRNPEIIEEILCWADQPSEIECISRRKEELYRSFIANDGLSALPGVENLLKWVKSEGVDCAVGSSTELKNIKYILDMIDLSPYFKSIISEDDVSRRKPDPEVFLKAAGSLKVDPERCVVFEDAPAGIEAGLAAGMKVIAVSTTHQQESLSSAHRVVDSLAAVDRAMLENLW